MTETDTLWRGDVELPEQRLARSPRRERAFERIQKLPRRAVHHQDINSNWNLLKVVLQVADLINWLMLHDQRLVDVRLDIEPGATENWLSSRISGTPPRSP